MKKDKLEKWLTARIAKELGLGHNSIDAKTPLLNYLTDGFQSWRVVSELEKLVAKSLPASILYARPTISELAKHVCLSLEESERVSESNTAPDLGHQVLYERKMVAVELVG